MIREYALSPHLFDANAEHNTDCPEKWRERLEEFITKLIWHDPETKICGVVVSNYCDAYFESQLDDICKESENAGSSFRYVLRGFQRLLAKHYVSRPSDGTYPFTQDDCIVQMQNTAKKIPIDRIVSTKSVPESSGGQEVFGLYDLHLQKSFWKVPRWQQTLAPNIETQVKALEKLLYFSNVIRLIIPYFCSSLNLGTGACTPHDEAFFPLNLLKRKVEACSQFSILKQVDIHTNCPSNYDGKEKLVAEKIAEFIAKEVPGKFDIKVHIADDKRNQRRILFAEEKNPNDDRLRTLWCVAMDHYARPNNSSPEPNTFWIQPDEEKIGTRDMYFPFDKSPLYQIIRRQ